MAFDIPNLSGGVAYHSGIAMTMREAAIEAARAGANLTGADLRGAILRGADLRGAILTGADLHWAILSQANLF
jgi:uncharacterized protein YjbI with pentapeptide repeats